jgi:hypothetical protein
MVQRQWRPAESAVSIEALRLESATTVKMMLQDGQHAGCLPWTPNPCRSPDDVAIEWKMNGKSVLLAALP